MIVDHDYYQHRAEQELERARRSELREAVMIHYQLAEAYLALIGTPQTPAAEAREASIRPAVNWSARPETVDNGER